MGIVKILFARQPGEDGLDIVRDLAIDIGEIRVWLLAPDFN